MSRPTAAGAGHAVDRQGAARGLGRPAGQQGAPRRSSAGSTHQEAARHSRPSTALRLSGFRAGRSQRKRQVDGAVRVRLRVSRSWTRPQGVGSRRPVSQLHEPPAGCIVGYDPADGARVSLPAPGRTSLHWKRGRTWNRRFTSRNGDSQPERQVYLRTLANLTSPAEVRSILQLGKRPVRTRTLDPDLLILAHRVLPWRYHDLTLLGGESTRDLLFAEVDDPDRTRYSEFHMSSGERTILRISKDISRLRNALVLIDEVETGLHPYTQQQTMLELQRLALRQSLQIIVATHSPVVLDSVPPEARIFLEREGPTGQVRQARPFRDIFHEGAVRAVHGPALDPVRGRGCGRRDSRGVRRAELPTGSAPRRRLHRAKHRPRRVSRPHSHAREVRQAVRLHRGAGR